MSTAAQAPQSSPLSLVTPAERATWHLDGPDGADRVFRRRIFSKIPNRFSNRFAQEYSKLYKSAGRQSANLMLLGIEDMLSQSPLPLSSTDLDIRDLARARALACQATKIRLLKTPARLYEALCRSVERFGLQPPTKSQVVHVRSTDRGGAR